MDLTKAIASLRAENAAISQAIYILEGIASGRGKRRGRPPKWMTGAAPRSHDGTKAYTRTPETRARMAAAARRRWAKRKRAQS